MKKIFAPATSLIFIGILSLSVLAPVVTMGQVTDQFGSDAKPLTDSSDRDSKPLTDTSGRDLNQNQPAPTSAQDPIKGIQNPLKGVESIGDLFYTIIGFIYSLSYVVVAIFLIISGFKFVAAQGSEDKLKDAKNTFYYTIIGAILLIGANVITEVVRNVINQLSANQI